MRTDTEVNPKSGSAWRSAAAVLAGLVFIFATHIGTDQVLHLTGVYPPLGEPMHDPRLYALALAYRILFSIAGCYVTAWLAPTRPMRHALVLGGIGVALSTAGAFVMWGFGPNWYPVALILVALPCAWAGGALYVRGRAGPEPA